MFFHDNFISRKKCLKKRAFTGLHLRHTSRNLSQNIKKCNNRASDSNNNLYALCNKYNNFGEVLNR